MNQLTSDELVLAKEEIKGFKIPQEIMDQKKVGDTSTVSHMTGGVVYVALVRLTRLRI